MRSIPQFLKQDEQVGSEYVKEFPAEKWGEHGVRFSKFFKLDKLAGGAVTTKGAKRENENDSSD